MPDTILDVFQGNAYGSVSLTQAIEKLPHVPSRLERLGLFTTEPVPTTTIALEELHGQLRLLETRARGSAAQTRQDERAHARTFAIPHIPYDDTLLADAVQNVRAFGQPAGSLASVNTIVNNKLQKMKQDHAVTWEYHRIGAISGVVIDADGSVIYNFFNEFGVAETEIDFNFFNASEELKITALSVERAMDRALGGTPYTGIHAFCGDNFFDALTTHPAIKESYREFEGGRFYREQQASSYANDRGFSWGGITWENYKGRVGAVDFIDSNTCRFIPVGAPNVFMRYNAPADFIESVNTLGLDIYAKQERLPLDRGIHIHTQSNPLFICTRPKALIKGVMGSESSSSSSSSSSSGA